jgi:hypothetical protein
MAEVGFHGADKEIGISLWRKDFPNGCYFDRVADWRSGAVAFEVAGVAGRELGAFVRVSDEAFLAFDAGVGDTNCLSIAVGTSEIRFRYTRGLD